MVRSVTDVVRILGSRIDKVSFAQALQLIKQLVSERSSHHVITGNTLMFLEAERDRELQTIIEHAALVVPESWGIRWASRRLKNPLHEFFPGIDLMTALCDQAAADGRSIYLLGAKPGVAQAAADQLMIRYPGLRVAGTHDGYFTPSEEAALLYKIRDAAPDYLFVGLSVPGQEKWIAKNLKALGVPVVMGVGGSFDVLSGRLKRAPAWMRHMGIEWVYRTWQEPWRWKRIMNLPVFMWRVIYP